MLNFNLIPMRLVVSSNKSVQGLYFKFLLIAVLSRIANRFHSDVVSRLHFTSPSHLRWLIGTFAFDFVLVSIVK